MTRWPLGACIANDESAYTGMVPVGVCMCMCECALCCSAHPVVHNVTHCTRFVNNGLRSVHLPYKVHENCMIIYDDIIYNDCCDEKKIQT